MKNTVNKIATFILLITVISCQDVVDVDLETSAERLVIEALIKWEQGTLGNNQIIKLSKTSSFYNNTINYVDNASVTVKNLNTQQIFNFLLTTNGIYQTTNFIPEINAPYELKVIYNGETYTANSTLFTVPIMNSITQSIDGGLSLIDPEINASFQDFQNQENFYKISFQYDRPSANEEIENFNYIFNDNFSTNNVIDLFYENEGFITDDKITITLYNISGKFHDFLIKLQAQEEGGIGPFASPPINVKGNIINTTNVDNYPYGYFSLNQIDIKVYIFQ